MRETYAKMFTVARSLTFLTTGTHERLQNMRYERGDRDDFHRTQILINSKKILIETETNQNDTGIDLKSRGF